ncbi:hypothetical protein ACFTZI_00620 [Streptomyces decoyicus]|uniref:hypothetical protein n=1 Tax=Streptomyces decoyicus TaxID=249567 RepID=UPI00363540F3
MIRTAHDEQSSPQQSVPTRTEQKCRTGNINQLPAPAELKAEGASHRDQIHGRHHPDGEKDGEVDRRGRWYADLGWLATLHARPPTPTPTSTTPTA